MITKFFFSMPVNSIRHVHTPWATNFKDFSHSYNLMCMYKHRGIQIKDSSRPAPLSVEVSKDSFVCCGTWQISRLKAPVHSLPSTNANSASKGVIRGARYSLLSRSIISAHAMRTNTSHSGKFANFAGLGLPITTVYDFLPGNMSPCQEQWSAAPSQNWLSWHIVHKY